MPHTTSPLPTTEDDMPRIAALAYLHDRTHQGLRPRLAVLGTDMDDAVSAAGGWIFDRSMAGWEVTVVTGAAGSARPARILGASALDLESALAHGHRRPPPQAIAVSAALMATEDGLRRRVREYLDQATVEAWIWGHRDTAAAGDHTENTVHRLSRAARAFKLQALRVVRGEIGTVAPTENFHTGRVSRRARQTRETAGMGWPVDSRHRGLDINIR